MGAAHVGLGWPLPFRLISLGIAWGVIRVVGLVLWLWGRTTAYALAAILLLESASNLLGSDPRPSAPEIAVYQ